MLDPTREGLWMVTTMSGTQYWIDARNPDRSATLTRLTHEVDPIQGFTQAELRRDGEPLTLLSVHHRTPTGDLADGLEVGREAIFTIAPLAPGADVTFRCTTAIRTVQRLDPARPDTGRAKPFLLQALTVPELLRARGADQWSSITDVAAAIADELAGDEDHVFTVIILAKGIDNWRSLADRELRARWFTARPPTTGDHRFDVLIAGTVRHLALEEDHPVPEWARVVPPLARPWSPVAFDDRTPSRTWQELDALNIVLDADFTEIV